MPSVHPRLLGLAFALSLASPAHADLCGTGPVDILLTNDDGYQAAGIRALYVHLRAAGDRVLLVAPDRNLSGTGASFTWGEVPVTRDPSDPNVFAVGATPATAVALGATALYPHDSRPDLVVSGINAGANVGSLLASDPYNTTASRLGYSPGDISCHLLRCCHMPRYRVPIDWILFILAGSLLWRVIGGLRAGSTVGARMSQNQPPNISMRPTRPGAAKTFECSIEELAGELISEPSGCATIFLRKPSQTAL